MRGWYVARLLTGVAVIGALATGCAVGPAADRAEREARANSPGEGPPDDGRRPGPTLPGGESTADPAPRPAPETGSATVEGDLFTGLTSACCIAELPDSEDLLVGSGDTMFLRPADGDGQLTELGQLPGELLALAVPKSGTGSFISVFAYFAGPSGGQVANYPYFPHQDWDPWGDSPTMLLDDPVPLAPTGEGGGGALAFGPDGELYLGTGGTGGTGDAESGAGQILRLDPNGSDAPVVHSPGPYTGVRGLAWDDDRMWAVDAGVDGGARLYSVTPGGPPIEVELPGVDAVDPAGLAASEGSLWMPGAADGQLWRIPLNGSNALVADPEPVFDLDAPRAVLPVAGGTDLWALTGDSLLRLRVD
jgi:glucose/arabinose dehydrogenase